MKSLADAYLIFNANTTKTLKKSLRNFRTKIEEKVKSNISRLKKPKERKQDSPKILCDLCISSRTCLNELSQSISSGDPKDFWDHIIRCKIKLNKILSKIRKINTDQNSQQPLIKRFEVMTQSFVEKMTEMSEKVKNLFQEYETKEMFANIVDLHSEISDFIQNNFEPIEYETNEDESEHTNVVSIPEPNLSTGEQVHNEAMLTVQSYYHLQHTKEQYMAKVTKIREVYVILNLFPATVLNLYTIPSATPIIDISVQTKSSLECQ